MADLKQLRYFVTAARSGSFVAASRILHVSQPALSFQIKHLEARHGVLLLERHSRGVVPTAEGLKFLRLAETALTSVRQANEFLDGLREPGSGILKIGCSATPSRFLIPPLLNSLKGLYGTIEVREGLSQALTHDVLASVLDVGLCYDFDHVERIHVRTLYEQHLALIGPPSLLAHLSNPVPFGQVEGIPLVLNAQAHAARRHLDLLASAHGVRLKIDYGVDSLVVMKELLGNDRCTIAPKGAFIDEIRAGALRACTIAEPPVALPLNLLLREDMPKQSRDFFISLITGIVKGLIDAAELDWDDPDPTRSPPPVTAGTEHARRGRLTHRG